MLHARGRTPERPWGLSHGSFPGSNVSSITHWLRDQEEVTSASSETQFPSLSGRNDGHAPSA